MYLVIQTFLMFQLIKQFYTISVNPANSKRKVYRQRSQEWFPGRHQIKWDIDAAELQEADTVDIHLFRLTVIKPTNK